MNVVLQRSSLKRLEEYRGRKTNQDRYWKERKAALVESARQEDSKRQKCRKAHANSGPHMSVAVPRMLCVWAVEIAH